MKKIYRTMKGKAFDMEFFSNRNSQVRAIGNCNMNARGDILGKLNEVSIPREKIENHPNRFKTDSFNSSLTSQIIPDDIDFTNVSEINSKTMDTPKEVQHRDNRRKKLK